MKTTHKQMKPQTNKVPRNSQTQNRTSRGKKVRNTRRVERTFKIIIFLNKYRTVKEISKHLDIHNKSVHRYFNMLIQLGFEINVKHSRVNFYKISNTKEFFKLK